VGHALQNDLKVLHLEHRMVVDTVLVFPHPEGPLRRMALRRLAKEHLRGEIQVKGQAGHERRTLWPLSTW
jgi:RNA exonuclease 1